MTRRHSTARRRTSRPSAARPAGRPPGRSVRRSPAGHPRRSGTRRSGARRSTVEAAVALVAQPRRRQVSVSQSRHDRWKVMRPHTAVTARRCSRPRIASEDRSGARSRAPLRNSSALKKSRFQRLSRYCTRTCRTVHTTSPRDQAPGDACRCGRARSRARRARSGAAARGLPGKAGRRHSWARAARPRKVGSGRVMTRTGTDAR